MLFDDLELGMERVLAPVTIEKEKMVAFAKEYDDIPLHTDEEYAKTTPFGTIIAPGVMSFMSVWAKYLEVDYFGDDLIAGKSTKMEWFKPVFAGDVLTGTARITNLVKRSPRNGLAEVTIDIRNQKGELVLSDITEAVVKCRRES
ncbi:MAG: MaoC family dehydratase N-terminal domain-containing protein [Clostridiales bacterium]|nr:MaoC family dehydratase N-terminal domain-containing protein [Clostridiales bacterium]